MNKILNNIIFSCYLQDILIQYIAVLYRADIIRKKIVVLTNIQILVICLSHISYRFII